MITIPISVAYFVFGFISCFALIIMFAIISVNKEQKNKKELMEKFMKNIAEFEMNDKENK